DLCVVQALDQAVFTVVVEEKADRAAVHPVNRDLAVQVAVHGLEHLPVAAQSDDDVCPIGRRIAIAGGESAARLYRLPHLACHKGDFPQPGHDAFNMWGPTRERALLRGSASWYSSLQRASRRMVNP